MTPPTMTEQPAAPLIEAPQSVLLHSGMSVRSVYTTYAIGALFPLAAGLAAFGWRALLVVAIVVGSAFAAMTVWKHIGVRGGQLRPANVLWMALLLALLLPTHLIVHRHMQPHLVQLWPILVASGITLVMVTWALGGIGVGRLHPVLATYLLLAALFGSKLIPHNVLQRSEAFTGNVLDADKLSTAGSHDPWISRPIVKGHAALKIEPASDQLQRFMHGAEPSWTSMDTLVRDRLPPIQDIVLMGNPAPIGQASAVAVVIGGLYLLYRGLIDYRIPLLIVVSLIISLHILPVPVVISDRIHWGSVILRDGRVSWSTAMTFVHYEMLASPALFLALFLAPDPTLRPMAKWARAVYAVFIGVTTAAAQRYLSVSVGPMIALLAASLLTPAFDAVFHPKPLV